MTKNNNVYFVLGLFAGAAGGLLLAPRSGVRTRERIEAKAKDGLKFVEGHAAEMRDAVSGQIDRARYAAKVTAEGIADALGAGRSALRG